jgi:hypothetical protein
VVVEIVSFRLAPGVSPEAFLEADASVQAGFFYLRQGIVRRTVARSGDDWAAVTFWGSMDDALSAAGSDDAGLARYRAMITGERVERFETLD